MATWRARRSRFGVFNSALFATITTAASCGAVNAMHDSFTPLGGLVLLFNMQTGEVIFGGVGAGLYGMLTFVVLAVFIAGLMVGRTPEYLGKKIQAYDVKLVMLILVVLSATVLGGTAWASVSPWGQAGLNNAGPHGFSEMLYAYSSAVGQQRFSVRRIDRHSRGWRFALEHHIGTGDVDRAFFRDCAHPRAGREFCGQEGPPGQRGYVQG
jgi:K+-transporting ATPase A subunit